MPKGIGYNSTSPKRGKAKSANPKAKIGKGRKLAQKFKSFKEGKTYGKDKGPDYGFGY